MAFFKKFKRLFKKIFFPAKSRRKSSRKVKKKIPRRTPRRSTASKSKRIQAKQPANSRLLKKNLKKTTGRPRCILAECKKRGRPAPTPQTAIGEITHFFPRIQVCVLKVSAKEIRVGDQVLIAGKKSRFIQKVASLQIESINVKSAKRGNLVGLKLDKPAEVGDKVFKIF